MIVVHVDCNALWRNVSLSNDVGKRLRGRLESGLVELHISPVVIGELRRQFDEELRASRSAATAAIERATRGSKTDTSKLVTEQGALFARLAKGVEDQFAELLDLDGVVVDHWPSVSARELGERELLRRRPFLDKPGGTVGLRDTLIWSGFVEGLDDLDSETDIAVFVSKDDGFKSPNAKGLHDDLLSDVNETFEGRAELAPSLFDVLTIVDLHEQAITRREAIIRSALSEFVRDLYNEAWDWGSTELPVDLESPRVLEAEYLGSEVIGDGNPAACNFTARIQIEGVMLKEQWYADSDSEVQLWDGEINEHYVSVYVERIVEFDVEVDVNEVGEVDYVNATAVHL